MAAAGRPELKKTALKDTARKDTGHNETGHKEIGHKEIGPTQTGLKPRGRWRALLVAGVVMAIGALVAWFLLPATAAETSDRHEVTAVATDFALEYNTYDMAELDEYQARMADLMTDSLHEEFSQVTSALAEAIAEKAQSSGSADVLSTAIKEIDATSATVLVAADAVVTNTDTGDVGAQRNFRWVLTLTSDAGQWRVDSFAAVTSPDVTTTPREGAGDGAEGEQR